MTDLFRFTATPPLSLYIHFPWCVRKCPYCDFNSHAVKDDLPEDAYIDALLLDLEQELPRVWGRTVQTVFMGGGTPSLFSPAAMDRLLAGVRARLPVKPDAEITLEANPGTVEQSRFEGYREAGINRLSIGVQSLNPDHLKVLGRIHTADEARHVAEAARRAGFDNINLDLMFGLPEQGIQQALDDLDALIALQPDHISWYQLTLEPNTLFYTQRPTLPDDDARWAMQEQGQTRLAGAGYAQYEVSAYARPGHQCRHNLNYWKFGDYLGIGAGAHGKISDAARSAIIRRWKKRHPKDYLAAARSGGFVDGERELESSEAIFEFALNRLRLKQPFTLDEFEAATGLPASSLQALITRACEDGLLDFDGKQVKHTRTGWRFLDNLVELFLPREVDHAGE
ncbi:anaerobic coproporphyrinogen III oxidase [Thiogranum longum]|uniref:Heme chaperone HemW n=1 Tax=Thiogranum longum TaxID=1537524 RepID=A0A4R1H987_9GAMM|nr:radical SAM family heme chaperone HemW [Thiogranum longum]TCK17033.1 anaerobic coproporphyrinogen III oxidase [Thiogranum longum]